MTARTIACTIGFVLLAATAGVGIVVLEPAATEPEALAARRVLATPVPSPEPRSTSEPVAARASSPALRPWTKATPSGPRGWVEIPAIGARGPLVAVGLDRNGEMIVPRTARDVAWLDLGGFPGPTRNAILAGHRNYSGVRGTFERLEDLERGDRVAVHVDGELQRYEIRWVKMFDPETAPVQELLGPTEVDSITLVTCGGPFDSSTRHYTRRWVARAERLGAPEPAEPSTEAGEPASTPKPTPTPTPTPEPGLLG